MRALSLVLCAFALVACGGSDVNIAPEDGGDAGPGSDGAANDGNATDSGMDGGPSDSGQPDSGQPDSGQPDSGACTCVPPVPMGWTSITLDRDARDPCPGLYGGGTDLVEGVTAPPASCGCTCQGVQTSPTCPAPASATLTIGDAQCANGTTASLSNQSSCNQASGNINGNTPLYGKVTCQVPNAVGGSCKPATGTVGLQVPTIAHQGRACTPTATFAACQNGDVCVPSVGSPWALCVAHTGAAPCPNGYPNQYVDGTGVNDTRGCTQCSCGLAAACDNPTLVLYADGLCSVSVAKLAANQPCTSLGTNNLNYSSFGLLPSLKSAACNANPISPIGNVSLQNPRTICCR